MQLVQFGLYRVKEYYFKDFGKGYWMDNKQEGRPYYYMFKDSDGVMWMIPISSQVENYKRKIERDEEKHGKGNCIYYHIGIVASEERVFLIGDMFPVTQKYIRSAFTINKVPYVSKNKKMNSELRTKAMKFKRLVETGVIKSRNDIIGIKQALMRKQQKKK